jgi:hypothetical protein
MLLLVLAAAVTAALVLLALYYHRRLQVARFARAVVLPCGAAAHEVAFALGRAIFTDVGRLPKDPVFLSRLLAPLGASPVTVLRKGGCCSGLHRLYITALDTLGIRSAQVTVLRRVNPEHAHCFVQVRAGGSSYLIDVDYGVWFHDERGMPLGLSDLQRGVTPVIEPFASGVARYVGSAHTRPPGFPDRDYYRFDYELTRTANWAEGPVKRLAYFVLKPLTGGRIDRLLLPPALEWPELLLAVALCGCATLTLLAARLLGT